MLKPAHVHAVSYIRALTEVSAQRMFAGSKLIKGSDCLNDIHDYGDEAQNDLMYSIDTEKGDVNMAGTRIKELMVEVDTYRQAIQDAKDALASAEQELDEVLAAEYENQ